MKVYEFIDYMKDRNIYSFYSLDLCMCFNAKYVKTIIDIIMDEEIKDLKLYRKNIWLITSSYAIKIRKK